MQKNKNFFKKSLVLLKIGFIFAPANGNTLANKKTRPGSSVGRAFHF